MALFGIAAEGVTDQIVIQNILCGYFDDEDLDEDIQYLQPPLDVTRQKQQGFGGWQMLLEYLPTKRFRDDVLNSRYLVLQVDTDVSPLKGFDIPHTDEQNQPLSATQIGANVCERLITQIEQGQSNFYHSNADKILFCVCVHSIECWLLVHYNPKPSKNPKLVNCEKALRFVLDKHHGIKSKQYVKNFAFYDQLSEPFLQRKNIDNAAKQHPGLSLFAGRLKTINPN